MNLAAVFTTLAAGDLTGHVMPHDLPVITFINNHMLMAVVAAVLVILVFSRLAKAMAPTNGVRPAVARGRGMQVFEVMCGFIRDEVARPALGHLTDKYIPYIWTTFFFVLFCNLLGLIPLGAVWGLISGFITGDWHPGSTTYKVSHIGGTATGNLAVTGALATISLFMINFVGIKENGLAYFKHFNPGPIWMAPLLVPLEIMGLLIKCVVLAMRLFGTMLAGHLVVAALIGLIFQASGVLYFGIGAIVMLGASALVFLEIFICFLQAFIFTFLTILFIAAGAVHEHDEHHEEEHDHDHAEAPHGAAVPA